MSRKPKWTLSPRDTVVAAWAEYAHGPGWANAPIWVLIRRTDAPEYEVQVLQPDEQPTAAVHLFEVSAVVSARMLRIVENHIGRREEKR